MRYIAILITSLTLSLSVSTAWSKSDDRSILWAGCGITKKAFMTEMAKSYQKDTGIKIILQGGGATKGIRGVA